MQIDLSGLCALVTSSTKGIGFAVAQKLAANGAEVAVNGRKAADVEAAVGKIRAAITNAKLVAAPGNVATGAGVATRHHVKKAGFICAAAACAAVLCMVIIEASLDELTGATIIITITTDRLCTARTHLGCHDRRPAKVSAVTAKAIFLLRCMSPLLAQSGHAAHASEYLLSGVKRTLSASSLSRLWLLFTGRTGRTGRTRWCIEHRGASRR